MLYRNGARYIRAFCTYSNNTKLATSISSTLGGCIDTAGVSELLVAVPELTKYTPAQWAQTHKLLVSEGLETDKILSIIGGHPSILVRSTEKIAESLHCWRSCQFGDANMKVLVSAHPYLLDYTNHGQLAQRVAFLHSHFESRKNVYRLFLNAPNLLVDEQRITEEKIGFLMETMRHEVLEVVKSCAFSHDLEHLRCRHTFLLRLGLFKPRSLKADPNTPTGNPKVHQITDTSDKRFAVKVAFVTLEEYEVFQELYRRETEQTDPNDWDDEEQEDVEEDHNNSSNRIAYMKNGKQAKSA